ncbi:Flexible cuticle protein 12 [Eufriesea mexicana]|uniref:Flexible cuticle protein 12 n=1 Tax=Eufriesea mexicana TaxID=516756 RepID=A0A310SB40_9HYME|nr:Flexible cuticle protein 12 [Eufriesea mexicana]
MGTSAPWSEEMAVAEMRFRPRAAFQFETLLTDRDSRCLVIATEWLLVTSHVDAAILIFVTVIVGALAAPQVNPNDITIVKQEEQNNIGVGGYHFSYEQSDGQKREETAELKNEGTDNESLDVTGSFTFTAPDGHTFR